MDKENKYEGLTCPVCHAKLFPEDDIAVCPECGAPHHRSCYAYAGKCAYSDTHGTPLQWKMPEINADGENGGAEENVCPKCGKSKARDALFCPYCGESFLNRGEKPPEQSPGSPFGAPFRGGAWMDQLPDPLGGVAPDETVDGLPVKETAAFVTVNTQRYIPAFKSLDKDRKKLVHWNWAAFFLPECWLFYRKCYKVGILAIFIALISNIFATPFMLEYSNILSALPTDVNYSQQQLTLHIMENIASIPSRTLWFAGISLAILLCVHVFFGLFGDYIYKRHVVSRITAIKSEFGAEDAKAEMTRQGSVNIMSGLAASMLVYVASAMLQTFLM